MAFNRTTKGQVSKYLFYDRPLLWVEGEDDIAFYAKILNDCNFHIQSAGGRKEAEKLIDALIADDLPYCVVIDGDYCILRGQRSRHRRAQILPRYSWENFLFQKQIIEGISLQCCRLNAGDVGEITQFDRAYVELKTKIKVLVMYDIASQVSEAGLRLLPDKINSLLD